MSDNPEFDSAFFAGNRARLRELFTGTAPIVLTANGALQRNADQTLPFRQDGHFWYLTGIDEPGIVLVMDRGKEYLIAPGRDDRRAVFDGIVDLEALKHRSGISDVMNEKDGWRQLDARLKRVQHVATLSAAPTYIEEFGMFSNPARAQLIQRMKQGNAGLELLDVRQHLARMRMIKQPAELAAIQRAIDITIDTLKLVTRPAQIAKYAYEYELEADITRGFRRQMADHAFAPIVASGERACVLHNVKNDAPLASGDLLTLDVGAEYCNYAADITRTLSLGQKPSRRQQQVFDAVLAVQTFAFSLLRPGVIIHTYEEQVEQFMGEKLRELGLIKSIDQDAVRRFYPHATSHFLGLDTHDVGDYVRPLEPGMVLTVEPGIYISDEGIGVRIEDDVLITPEGIRILSDRLPRTL